MARIALTRDKIVQATIELAGKIGPLMLVSRG